MSPSIYLAARFDRQEEMRAHRNALRMLGYTVTSSWLDQIGPDTFGTDGSISDLHIASDRAIQDISDVTRADMFFHFTDQPSSTGGRHTEFGIALALGKLITIIGPRENVFQALATFAWYPNWETFLQAIKEANGATDEAWSSTSTHPTDSPAI